MLRPHRKPNAALTLIEILIALLIAAMMSIAFMGAIVYMLRQTAANRAQLVGVSVADYYQSLVYAAAYKKLGATGISQSDFNYLFTHDEDNPIIVNGDPNVEGTGTQYRVWFQVTGFGGVSSAGDNSIVAQIPTGLDNWEPGEWVNNYVTITKGFGSGQIMRITANTGNTLTVTSDLSGEDTSVGFKLVPNTTSSFVINNGKTVRIFVDWGPTEEEMEDDEELVRKDFQRIVRTVLVRHVTS